MILGFGNNIVSSLASDITAGQTTIPVIPGDGQLFASLLTSDFSNKSTALKNYAKITLTDSGETAFEICHLTAVTGDNLTVVRGQEGTVAKGWALKDVIANFATRGSENGFPQIAHIQSGFYTSGTAGGSANALTLELPSTFFLNGSVDWALKTPIVVYPSQNNTGAATLQLTMGGKVLGTFKLYKGNKLELAANDIIKGVALVCLMDGTKAFFSVANPGAIYAGLGTAAFKDIVTSMTDTTSGRIPVVGWMGLGGYAPNVDSSVGGLYTAGAGNPDNPDGTGYAQLCIAPSGFYSVRLAIQYSTTSPTVYVRTIFGDDKNAWLQLLTTNIADNNYLAKSKNLSDIPNKSSARNALELGSAATLDAGTSSGNVMKVGAWGWGALAPNSPTDAVTSVYWGGSNTAYAPVKDRGFAYFNIGVSGTYRTRLAMDYSNQSAPRLFYQNIAGTTYSPWFELYHTGHKPTAADVGAQTDTRLGSEVTVGSDSFTTSGIWRYARAPSGHVLVGLGDANNVKTWLEDVDALLVRPLQKQINGTWYTVSQQ